METINERFRQAREMTGLAQEAFAAAANRTRSEIKNIEYGKTTPKEEVITSVCRAHGINPSWLREGVGEPFLPKSREDELAEAFANVQISDEPKAKLIKAIAMMPDEAFPAFLAFVEGLAKTMSDEE